jgi:hypothetical protein
MVVACVVACAVACAVVLTLDAVAALTECLPVRTKADMAAKAIARKVIPINVFFDFFMLCDPPKVFRTINQSDS